MFIRASITATLFIANALSPLQVYTQNSQWRDEDMGNNGVLPIRSVHGKYLAQTWEGLYEYDSVASSWISCGRHTTRIDLIYSKPQVSGVLLQREENGMLRYNTQTGEMTERNGWSYHHEYTDSIVCRITAVDSSATTSSMTIADWMHWPSGVVVKSDSVQPGIGHNWEAISCSDSTLLLLTVEYSLRLSFTSPPVSSQSPLDYVYFRSQVYYDEDRTHIIINNDDSLVYSHDNGVNWSSIPYPNGAQYSLVVPCHEPNEVFVLSYDTKDGYTSFQFDLTQQHADTIVAGSVMNYNYQSFAPGRKGILLNTRSGMSLFSSDSHEIRPFFAGLPPRGVNELRTLNNGVVALSIPDVLMHESNSEWLRLIFDNEADNSLTNRLYSYAVLAGGTSIDDIWLATLASFENLTFCRFNRSGELKSQINYPNGWRANCTWQDSVLSGALTHHLNIVYHIIDSDNRDELIVGSSNIRFIGRFFDSIFVAIANDGKQYRSSDNIYDWKESACPKLQPNYTDWPPVSYSIKGANGCVVFDAVSQAIRTNDAGMTWSLDSLEALDNLTVTNAGVIYRIRPGDDSSSFIIEQLYNNHTSFVSTIQLDSFEIHQLKHEKSTSAGYTSRPKLAYDETEARLYVGTTHWVKSLQIEPNSINEDRSRTLNRPDVQSGYYDLLGRFIGAELTSAGSARGCYIYVSPQGATTLYSPF